MTLAKDNLTPLDSSKLDLKVPPLREGEDHAQMSLQLSTYHTHNKTSAKQITNRSVATQWKCVKAMKHS